MLLAALLAYLMVIVTLGQFCESKAVKKNSCKYRCYQLILFPITFPFKLCGIDVNAKIRRTVFNIEHGKTYVITTFYYLLYTCSAVFCVLTNYQHLYCLFPEVLEDHTVQWRRYDTGVSGLQLVPRYLTAILACAHVLALISFTVAVRREANYKNNPDVYDNVLYIPDIECEDCKQTKPPRSSHCEQCAQCVNKRDHHCIWINRCVGRRNILWFNLFLLNVAIACFLESFLCLIMIQWVYSEFPTANTNMHGLMKANVFPFRFFFTWLLNSLPMQAISFMMHLIISIMMIPFSVQHIIQALTNVTSLENQKKYYIKQAIKQKQMMLFMANVPKEQFKSL